MRQLRLDRGWTVEQVAQQLQFSPSKISRLENGLRGVSAGDIRYLCDLYDVRADQRQQLVELAAQGKQRPWWQSANLPYSRYIGLEAEAASIRDFGIGVIPGLLQTEDYARAVLAASQPPLPAELIEQRLAGRMERQRLLNTDRPPEFDAVIDEAVLHRVGGSHAIMRAQLQHLLAVSEQPNVSISVLPYGTGILPFPATKFIVLTFTEPSVPGVVYLERQPRDLYLGPDDGLADYEQAFRAMKDMAAGLERSREIIAAMAAELEE